MMSEYKNQLLYFLKSKKYMISVIITLILSFGFAITHESMGIDDISFDRYINGGMYWLSQNRYGMWILYNILNLYEFTPFWTDFIVTISIGITALILCLFVRKNFSQVIKSDWVYVIFSCILISNPMINFYYTYQVSSISVTLCNILSIILGIIVYENYFNKKTKKLPLILLVGLALSVAISTYESCIQTYLVFVFLSMFLKSAINNKEIAKKAIISKIKVKEDKNSKAKVSEYKNSKAKVSEYKNSKAIVSEYKNNKVKIKKNNANKENNKELMMYFLINVGIMVIGVVFYYLINKIIHIILEQNGKLVDDYSSTAIIWKNEKVINSNFNAKINLFLLLIIDFVYNVKSFLPITIFVAFLIITLYFELVNLLKTNNSLRTLSFLGMIFANFIIPILQLSIVHRTLFSLIITIAILGAYVYNCFCTKKNLKYVLNICAILLILHESRMLNNFFVNDYKRYEREKVVANSIAIEVVNNYDFENKPLVFYIEKPAEVQQKYGRIHKENSISIMWWGLTAFDKPQEETIKFVNYLGYSFKFPTKEQVENAKEEYNNLKEDEKKNIVEFDNYIVVNLEKYDFFKEFKR